MIPSFAGSRILGSLLGTAVIVGSSIGLVACEEEPFSKSMTLGGKQVSAETLNAGKEAYMHYCRACHGDKGDGRGPAALGLRPPPRDFTQGKFKFAAVESGSLPNDEDFRRIVKKGLHGTAMLEWDVPDGELANIIQFIKTFSPKWQKEKPGTPIVAPPDPWTGQEQAAIQRGKELYHVTTQCAGCHPNYATKDDIAAMTMKLKKFQVTTFRDDMYGSDLEGERVPHHARPRRRAPRHRARQTRHQGAKRTAPRPKAHGAKAEAHGAKAAGKAEAKPNYYFVSILPPDFTRQPLRSGTEIGRSVPHHRGRRGRHRDALLEGDRGVHRSEHRREVGRRQGHLGACPLRQIARQAPRNQRGGQPSRQVRAATRFRPAAAPARTCRSRIGRAGRIRSTGRLGGAGAQSVRPRRHRLPKLRPRRRPRRLPSRPRRRADLSPQRLVGLIG